MEGELNEATPPVPREYFGVHNAGWRLASDGVQSPWVGFVKADLHPFVRALSGRFVFSVVRNPYARLLSAYRDKAQNLRHGGHERFRLDRAPRSFADFVDMIVGREPHELDIHFRPQSYSLGCGLIRLDAVARLECISSEIAAISERAFGTDRGALLDMKSSHETGASQAVLAAYGAPTREKVAAFFEDDFTAFGYDFDIGHQAPKREVGLMPEASQDREEVLRLVANVVSLQQGQSLDPSEISALVEEADVSVGGARALIPAYRAFVQFKNERIDAEAALRTCEQLPGSAQALARPLFRFLRRGRQPVRPSARPEPGADEWPIGTGMLTVANDRMAASLDRLLTSVRRFNRDMPIRVIPFDDHQDVCARIVDRHGAAFHNDGWREWREIGGQLYGEADYRRGAKAADYFRKLAIFTGPFERFVFLDANALCLTPLEPVLRAFGQSGFDLVFHNFALPNRNFADEQVRDLVNGINPTVGWGLNAGLMISRRDPELLAFARRAAVPGDRLRTVLGPAPEQGFLSYVAAIAGLRLGRMCDLFADAPASMSADQGVEERQGAYVRPATSKEPGKRLYFLKFRGPDLADGNPSAWVAQTFESAAPTGLARGRSLPKSHGLIANIATRFRNLRQPEPVRFVQIGGNDGSLADPLSRAIRAGGWEGDIYEPVPAYFDHLRQVYRETPAVRCHNQAVSNDAGTMSMFVVDPQAISADRRWLKGIASLDRSHLLRHKVAAEDIREVRVEVVSAREVAERMTAGLLDLLILDVEGHEQTIIDNWPFDTCLPHVLVFESKNLSKGSLAAVYDRIAGQGFLIFKAHPDTICVHAHADESLKEAIFGDRRK